MNQTKTRKLRNKSIKQRGKNHEINESNKEKKSENYESINQTKTRNLRNQ